MSDDIEGLAECIQSGQVPEHKVPVLCAEHPGLRERIAVTEPPPPPKIGLFEDNALPLNVSLKQQIACVERELKMRARVYPREVAMGRKSVEEAKSEIGQMQAVLRTLMQVQRGAVPPEAAG